MSWPFTPRPCRDGSRRETAAAWQHPKLKWCAIWILLISCPGQRFALSAGGVAVGSWRSCTIQSLRRCVQPGVSLRCKRFVFQS